MNKKIIFLTAILIILLPIYCFASYEIVNKQNIASGVILNNITRFSSEGWTYINLLEIDMNNSNVKISLIYSQNGISNLVNIKDMVKSSNAIAGINADYFAKRNDMTNRGQAISFSASNGNILTSASDENQNKDEFATYILNEDKSVLYTYLKDNITLYSPETGESIYVADINKFLPLEAPCCIFTSAFKTSIGNSKGDHMIELVVENDIVKEIRENQEGTIIPENGYIVSAYGDKYGKFLLDNFKVGSKIKYTVDINIDVDKIETAISGGSILVNKGIVSTSFSHNIYGKHEFTVIGSNSNNSKTYLLTITRKDGSSTDGVTLSELANIVKDLGMYNALCLDGGGSTEMVARQEGSKDITSVNVKDGTWLRPVINGIGIFTTSKTSSLDSIYLKLDNDKIFINNSTSFNIIGYDKNLNPIDLDVSKIKFTFSNNNIKLENNKFIGLKEGNTTITATYGNISKSINITVLGEIFRLEISPKRANIDINKTQFFTLKGYDKNGYSAPIDNSLVKWSVNGSGSISDKGLYTSAKEGISFVCATLNNVKTYSKIAVGNVTSYSYMPEDVCKTDELNYSNIKADFKIALIEELSAPSTLFDSIKNGKVISELNNSNLVIFNKGNNNSDLLSQLKTTYIENSGYIKREINNCSIITINSNDSIRKTDFKQWDNLINDIKNTKQNVIIVLNSKLDDFTDLDEKQLLLDILSAQKEKTNYNYWIIEKGNVNKCINYNGVKILTIGNSYISKTDITSNIDNYSYLKIYITGNEISYEIKNVF